jgi:hypothetical protein
MNTKKCHLCGAPITEKTNGFSGLLDNSESERLLKIQSVRVSPVCIECKYLLMATGILKPFYL